MIRAAIILESRKGELNPDLRLTKTREVFA